MIWFTLILLLPYFFIFLGFYRILRNERPFIPIVPSYVKISVIIACRNEEKNLPHLLNDLSLQDYNPDLFEVIVVDDHSTDDTFAVARAFENIHKLKVIINQTHGKKGAIGAGVTASAGELILTTDADCRPGVKWIRTISEFYSTTNSDMIIAPVALNESSGFAGAFQELEFLSLQGVTAATAIGGKPVMCNGANLAFIKKIYLKHCDDLHSEIESGDDIFLLHSLKKDPGANINWLSSNDAVVTTGQTESLNSFLKQRARWISKAGGYNDRFTISLSALVAITSLLISFYFIEGIIRLEFLPLFILAFLIKSIPDILILYETTRRYKKTHLLKWFIPSQLIYPYYIITVIFRYLLFKNKWR